MAFLCPSRVGRATKSKKNKVKEPKFFGRITGSDSIDSLVRVGLRNNGQLEPESKMLITQNFVARVEEELDVIRGQEVYFLYQDNDWTYVLTNDGKEGFVPSVYCSGISNGSFSESLSNIQEDKKSSGDAKSNSSSISSIKKFSDTFDSVDSNSIEKWSDFSKLSSSSLKVETTITPEVRWFRKTSHGQFIVLFDFKALDENDVTVERAELVEVLNIEDPDWSWIKRFNGDEGFVPKSYICPVEPLLALDKVQNYQNNIKHAYQNMQRSSIGQHSVQTKTSSQPFVQVKTSPSNNDSFTYNKVLSTQSKQPPVHQKTSSAYNQQSHDQQSLYRGKPLTDAAKRQNSAMIPRKDALLKQSLENCPTSNSGKSINPNSSYGAGFNQTGKSSFQNNSQYSKFSKPDTDNFQATRSESDRNNGLPLEILKENNSRPKHYSAEPTITPSCIGKDNFSNGNAIRGGTQISMDNFRSGSSRQECSGVQSTKNELHQTDNSRHQFDKCRILINDEIKRLGMSNIVHNNKSPDSNLKPSMNLNKQTSDHTKGTMNQTPKTTNDESSHVYRRKINPLALDKDRTRHGRSPGRNRLDLSPNRGTSPLRQHYAVSGRRVSPVTIGGTIHSRSISGSSNTEVNNTKQNSGIGNISAEGANTTSDITEFIVMYDYTAQSKNDLTVKQGDIVYVDATDQSDQHWLWVHCPQLHMYGYVPRSYVKVPIKTTL